ncbi:ABC transporter permease [Streptomyces boninensis]|uniref:ABC transporter permease n=1 Tax=Streptomyces boninensis TaxID=2039455 RepID=UPI003B225F0C
MKTLIKLEVLRSLRNKKYMFFSVIYPAGLYLLITSGGNDTIKGTGLDMSMYFMVSMASFGALTAVLLTSSERIAKERDSGWVRQLRLTALPGRGYVVAKIAAAATVTLPSIVLVLITGATVKGVRLDAWQWPAIGFATWVGSFAFAALGVAIGYLVSGDAVRPVAMVVYFTLAMLGGLWVPFTTFPDAVQTAADILPTHHYAALGQAIEAGGAPHGTDVAVLAAWLAAFVALAAWLYRKDTRKA